MAVINTEDEYKRLIQASKGGATNLPLTTGTATATPLGVSQGTPAITPLSTPTAPLSKAPMSTPTAATGGYMPAQVPTATSQSGYLDSLYSAQKDANTAALQGAYQQNVNALNATAAKIPEQYTAARNQTAAGAEVGRRNFNEYAAASGLNTGAGGQAQLAMNTALQGNLSSIDQAEATALSNIETERLQLQTEYQSAIAMAMAQSNISKAQALYEEAIRLDDSMVSAALNQADENYRAWSANQAISEQERAALESQAQNLAAYGDFSGYGKLGYTADQLAQMQSVWAAGNPTLASALGIKGSNNNYNPPPPGKEIILSDRADAVYQGAQNLFESSGIVAAANYLDKQNKNYKSNGLGVSDDEYAAIGALLGI